ncbi:MAG: hypothetical protein ACPHDT_07040 [Acidimicrobiales bacterium]
MESGDSSSVSSDQATTRWRSLREQGWTLEEIAEKTGWHPATISKRLGQGPPPAKRAVPDEAKVMNARWSEKVETLIEKHPRLLGISVFHCLQGRGLHRRLFNSGEGAAPDPGPRFKAADRVSVPIQTDPGEGAQFDFCHLDEWPVAGAGTARCDASG